MAFFWHFCAILVHFVPHNKVFVFLLCIIFGLGNGIFDIESNVLLIHLLPSFHIGSLISIIYLALNSQQLNNSISDSLLIFDNLSYRTIGIGFCFLTLGILSGAVWANETWGTYWSWDPKETWALITWLTFAIYLHTRLLYGWDGQKSAILGSCGFVLIWVCYLGVNLLGKGLHTYGFLSS